MQTNYVTNMHNTFLYCDNPDILGNFLLFVGQDQLGENYLPPRRVRPLKLF